MEMPTIVLVIIFTPLAIILALATMLLYIMVKKTYEEYRLEHPKKSLVIKEKTR